ncbi:MAG: hypothetical protein ACM3O7_07635 [Acidobacteriota bacterium]
MRILAAASTVIVMASSAWALLPSRDAYLPTVGHGQGVCVGDPPVCSQWRSTAWVYNPSTVQSAHVAISFLRRDAENLNPVTEDVTVPPGASVEFDDVVLSLFGADGAYGALRFASDQPVAVTGRIYDANVQTAKGTGTAGQFEGGLDAASAIGAGETVDLIGLAQDAAGVWRSNFGFVETNGAACTVTAQLVDASGAAVGDAKSYPVAARSQRQFNLGDLVTSPGTNLRLRVGVSDGQGKVVAFANVIDNRSGDPSNVDMAGQGHDGTYVGKQDKTSYDTPVTLTVAGNRVTDVDATILFTDEDVPACSGGELASLAGALPQSVVVEDDGTFSFVLSNPNVGGGLGVALQVDGVIDPTGHLGGTVTTTLTGAGSCSGTRSWPLVGARVP